MKIEEMVDVVLNVHEKKAGSDRKLLEKAQIFLNDNNVRKVLKSKGWNEAQLRILGGDISTWRSQ